MNKTHIINDLKNTVGYHESDNKAEYLKGAGMALDKCLAEHGEWVRGKNTTINHLETDMQKVKKAVYAFNELLLIGEGE